MKRGYWILIIVIVLAIMIGGYFWLSSGEEPLFAPSDVKVRIRNAPPQITDVPAVPVAVSLTPGTTTDIIVQFTVRDPNGADDLNDAAASATFSKSGEVDRVGSCVVNSVAGKSKTYDCTVSMQYYDAAGAWTITFYIEDLATPTPGSDSDNAAIATIGQLKAILYNTNIDLGIITPSDVNVPLADVVITNEGNFVVPTDGTLNVLARDLVGVTTPAESILASVFLAGDSSGDVCTLGSALIDNSNVNTNVAIPRGAAGSNVGSLGFCISLVPEVSAQDYEATVAGGNPWLIEI